MTPSLREVRFDAVKAVDEDVGQKHRHLERRKKTNYEYVDSPNVHFTYRAWVTKLLLLHSMNSRSIDSSLPTRKHSTRAIPTIHLWPHKLHHSTIVISNFTTFSSPSLYRGHPTSSSWPDRRRNWRCSGAPIRWRVVGRGAPGLGVCLVRLGSRGC